MLNSTQSASYAANQSNSVEQYLSFKVGVENYCINILDVKEIKSFSHASPMPNALEFLTGILNIRGTVVPIFDLKCRFGFGKTDLNPNSVVVIVALNNEVIGILVDSVSDILNINTSDIKDSHTVKSSISEDFLKGMAFQDDQSFIILNTSNLFSDEVLKSLHAIKAQQKTKQEVN